MSSDIEDQEIAAVDLGTLLDAREDAVVTLVTGDTRLVVHKAILVARSPVFEAMFHHDMLEASRGEVVIPDVDGPVLRQMLAYLYTLQVPKLTSTAPELLVAADKYGISALMAECEQQVARNITVDNAAATALLAMRHSCPILTKAVITYIKYRTYKVMPSQDWIEAVRSQPDAIRDLIHLLSSDRMTRLRWGALSGHLGVVRHLLANGAEVNAKNCRCERTLLYLAVRSGHLETVRYLLDSGAKVDVRDSSWVTPLHYAALNGHSEVMKCLLARGAKVVARDRHQQTPLHLAALYGHLEAVRCLLDRGAKVNIRDSWRTTPLHLAAEMGYVAVVQLLAQFSADLNIRCQMGRTPLDKAALQKHTEVVAALLEAGADVETTLCDAAHTGNLKMMRCLLEGGAEVGARNHHQHTPLHLAAIKNRVAVVRLLVAFSADPNAIDDVGQTPLHKAVYCSHTEMATVLLEAGASRVAKDHKGMTPLDIATQMNIQQLVHILK